jgi:hypothetical protein
MHINVKLKITIPMTDHEGNVAEAGLAGRLIRQD